MRCAALLTATIAVAGCSSIPNLPPENSLPIRAIAHHAACELHEAVDFARRKYGFSPTNWTADIKLSPSISAEVDATAVGSIIRPGPGTNVLTWAFGAGAPGAEYDRMGSQDDIFDYQMNLVDLMNKTKFRTLSCDDPSLEQNASIVFMEPLGLTGLFDRVITTRENQVYAEDSISQSLDLKIKYDGSASPTYTVTKGSIGGTLMGTYIDDENLTISLTYTPPTGSNPPGGKASLIAIPSTASQKLQNLNIIQQLQRINGPR